MHPNVLLIVFDTARADAFEPYGAAAGSSPVLADLASRGLAHPNMHAAACWTVPSHAAMLTGMLPRAAGLARAPGGRPNGCRPVLAAHAERLLPEVLRRAGYETSAVSTNLWLTPLSGFDTGFDRFVTVDTRRQADLTTSALTPRLRWVAEALRARVDDGAAEAEAVLSEWLGAAPDRPFFGFVNLVECHSPYLPPKPYNDLGVVERGRAAVEARRHLTMGEIWRACAGGFDVPDGALERMRRLYAGAVRGCDDWLGRVLGSLAQAGALDDTLVIATSDHGENFGEDGLMGHAYSLDERLTHVPLIAAGPGSEALLEASSLAGLPAAIADAIGLEEHPWHDPPGADGVAVAEFDPPASADDPRVAKALRDWGLGADAAPRLTTSLTSATDGRLKLLRRGELEELYDLGADGGESAPLAASEAVDAEAVKRLRGAIDSALEGGARPQAQPDAGAAEEISDEERQALEERMRLLGYL